MTVDEISNTGNTARSHTSNHPVSTLNTFVRRTQGVHRYETRCEDEYCQNFKRVEERFQSPSFEISFDQLEHTLLFASFSRDWFEVGNKEVKFLNYPHWFLIVITHAVVILSFSISPRQQYHTVSYRNLFIRPLLFPFFSFSSFSLSLSIYLLFGHSIHIIASFSSSILIHDRLSLRSLAQSIDDNRKVRASSRLFRQKLE